MKPNELRNLSDQELTQKEKALKKELFDLTYQKEIGQVEKPGRFRNLRRDIARIQTIFKERELKDNGRKS